MKRRERGIAKRGENREKASSSQEKRKRIKGWRRWVFPGLCLIIAPVCILLIFEVCLRILDYGYPADFYHKRKSGREVYYTENEKFGWRFFPRSIARRPLEQIVSHSQNDKNIRIVVLGESASMGDPDPSFSFGRILEIMLNNRHPEHRFEVINAAMTGINSHVIREIAKDALKLKPDFFIIYAGNNEVVGPFGAGTAFSPFSGSLFLIRMKIWIESTKTGQFLNAFRTFLAKKDSPSMVWGMNLFLKRKVRFDDKRLVITYRHFGKNIKSVCEMAKKSGVKALLCSVAVNLRSCPPFASSDSSLGKESGAERENLISAGIENENQKRYDDATQLYMKALKIDDSNADLHYRLGNRLYQKGDVEKARDHFILARDMDCLRFRTDSGINRVIRDIASSGNAILVDAEKEIARSAQNHIPGDDLFYDHVHFNFSGNYRMARMLANAVEENIPLSPSGEIPDEAECASLLAFTEFDQRRILNLMMERMSMPPFTNQTNQASMMAEMRGRLRLMDKKVDREGLFDSISVYESALKKNPEDWTLYENFAQLLQNTDYAKKEAEIWRGVIRLLPHREERWASLGQALAKAGDYKEAIEACEKALKSDRRNPTAHNGLGMAYAGMGNMERAQRHYLEALRLKQDYLEARHNLGILYAKIGDSSQVIEHLSEIVSRNPDDPESHFTLGIEWAKLKDYEKAEHHFSEVTRIAPENAEAHYNLEYICAEQGRLEKAAQHYIKALESDPDYADAHNNLGTLYAQMGMFANAVHHFNEVLRIKPEDASIHYNLGLAFSNLGEWKKAIKHFERLVQAAPEHARGRYQLGLNLERMGEIKRAVEEYIKALELKPDWAEVENQLAWTLAVSPQAGIRDPEESIKFAQRTCQRTEYKDPSYLDTLAAAYASSGRFREAMETAEKALNLALATNQTALAEDIKTRMEFYKQGLPFYESENSGAPSSK
ncbi:tetratricopeptide repeat protein [Candidatus Sumerlaeota bacterium]|nr:tetratricopeptide repeat protein [Candidatus Sumerlaeota bacterium]